MPPTAAAILVLYLIQLKNLIAARRSLAAGQYAGIYRYMFQRLNLIELFNFKTPAKPACLNYLLNFNFYTNKNQDLIFEE